MDDDKNPKYIFQLIDTELLVKIVKGEIDAVKMAKKELKNRCLNNDGDWENA